MRKLIVERIRKFCKLKPPAFPGSISPRQLAYNLNAAGMFDG